MGRMDKINQQLKKEVGRIIQEDMQDPRVTFVSITNVDVSPDLRNGKIYFSVLGETNQSEAITNVLNKARGMIRRLVSQRMNLRHTPELSFHYDSSIENSSRVEEMLKEINDEYNQKHHRTDDQA